MKIVILNECFLSESQLSELSQDNEVEKYNVTDNTKDAKERMKNAEVIFVDQFVCPLSNEILEEAKNLRLIILNTTSYHLLDLDYIQERWIIACNTPDFCSTSVAELAFFYILCLSRKTFEAYRDNQETPFEILPDDMWHRKYVWWNLEWKTLWILGLWNIGSKVAQIGNGFSMDVIWYNRSLKNITWVHQKDLAEVMSESDILVITLPYSNDTKNILNRNMIESMKKWSIIVNISSHEILDEVALIERLQDNSLAWYGLDNFTNKDKNHYFYNSDKVTILPHLWFFSQESLEMIWVRMMEGYRGFLNWENTNKVI